MSSVQKADDQRYSRSLQCEASDCLALANDGACLVQRRRGVALPGLVAQTQQRVVRDQVRHGSSGSHVFQQSETPVQPCSLSVLQLPECAALLSAKARPPVQSVRRSSCALRLP